MCLQASPPCSTALIGRRYKISKHPATGQRRRISAPLCSDPNSFSRDATLSHASLVAISANSASHSAAMGCDGAKG